MLPKQPLGLIFAFVEEKKQRSGAALDAKEIRECTLAL
jgi:hypothetical protein